MGTLGDPGGWLNRERQREREIHPNKTSDKLEYYYLYNEDAQFTLDVCTLIF